MTVLGGIAGGVIWRAVSRTPRYRVTRDGAYLDEAGLATVFNADGWFLVIGLVGGLALGWVLTTAYRDKGWRLVMGLLLLSGLACVLAYATGRGLGPSELDPRLQAAGVGERVVAPLRVRASGVYLSWPAGAMAGVLVASLGRRRARPHGDDQRTGDSSHYDKT